VARPAVEAGKILPIAATATQRANALPDVGTAREQGYPELEFDGMVGAFALKVVPPEARQRVENDVIEFSRDKAVFDRLTATAQVVNPAGARTSPGRSTCSASTLSRPCASQATSRPQ
jgi:tripartite-type tricarboxylate transporter receptor subunit TctC